MNNTNKATLNVFITTEDIGNFQYAQALKQATHSSTKIAVCKTAKALFANNYTFEIRNKSLVINSSITFFDAFNITTERAFQTIFADMSSVDSKPFNKLVYNSLNEYDTEVELNIVVKSLSEYLKIKDELLLTAFKERIFDMN